MRSEFKRLGDYIRLVDVRNSDGAITFLRGISVDKELIESKANMTGVSTRNYKIVKNGQFVYTADTSRRGDKIALAYNESGACIVSSIYTVFEVIDHSYLLPDFLFMWFKRPEFDRYARFNSWGSARETFDWATLCDTKIPLPDIEVQRKYVALYKALQKNQQVYERSLDDLQLICDSFLEDLKNKVPYQMLGEYIEQSAERNDSLAITNVQGVSNVREFVQTKANMRNIKTNNYKIVRKGEFAYNPSRLNIGSIALQMIDDCIVSPMYIVFKILEPSVLLPEYLFLWFKRQSFCNYVWFYSFGSVRDTFDYSLMENVRLPIPDIEVQKSIVAIHHVLESRKRLSNELKAQIQSLCPILMRGVVEELS